MREWFKARNIWGAAITALADEEAGRLAKALWIYTMTGEKQELTGSEKGVFALILMTLCQDEERDSDISAKRAIAGAMGNRKRMTNASKPEQTPANASKTEQTQAKPAIAEAKQTMKKFVAPTVEEVRSYCKERGNRVDAERFVDFYASKGWRVGNQPMKDWKAAVRTWEQRDDNRGTVGKTKTVAAQQYGQRDYSGKQQEMLDLQYAMMEAEMAAK